jgi:protein-disulfide isomerase
MKPLRLDVKTADRPASGPAGAPVTVVEFSDFQCAACGAFEATLRGALQKYGQQVRLVFRNFVMPQDVKAEKAAEAALCASDQGRFWEMHKLLFQANRLEERDLMAAAAFLDLDLESFAACLGSGRHAAKVKQDLYDAAAVGVTSAPVFFINGRMLVSPRNVGDITKLVEEELQSSWSPAAPRPRPAKNPF